MATTEEAAQEGMVPEDTKRAALRAATLPIPRTSAGFISRIPFSFPGIGPSISYGGFGTDRRQHCLTH